MWIHSVVACLWYYDIHMHSHQQNGIAGIRININITNKSILHLATHFFNKYRRSLAPSLAYTSFLVWLSSLFLSIKHSICSSSWRFCCVFFNECVTPRVYYVQFEYFIWHVRSLGATSIILVLFYLCTCVWLYVCFGKMLSTPFDRWTLAYPFTRSAANPQYIKYIFCLQFIAFTYTGLI